MVLRNVGSKLVAVARLRRYYKWQNMLTFCLSALNDIVRGCKREGWGRLTIMFLFPANKGLVSLENKNLDAMDVLKK